MDPKAGPGARHVTSNYNLSLYSLSLYRQCGADSKFVSKGGALPRQIALPE